MWVGWAEETDGGFKMMVMASLHAVFTVIQGAASSNGGQTGKTLIPMLGDYAATALRRHDRLKSGLCAINERCITSLFGFP